MLHAHQEEERAAREEQLASERAETERRLQEEEAERRRLHEERQRLAEQARLEEQERQRQERQKQEQARLEHAERAKREEVERQTRLKAEGERKEALEIFCRRHGFTEISAPRRSGCALWSAVTTYPLHVAAELGDVRIVEMLLKEGVSLSQKNSAGQIAAEVAKKKNKNGSHDGVQSLLGSVPMPRSGGA